MLTIVAFTAPTTAQVARLKSDGRSSVATPATSNLVINLRSGAPFSRLVLKPTLSRSCPSTGCELRLVGVTAKGEERDLTFQEILTNGHMGSRAQMIGPADRDGMPRLTYQQGNLDGADTFNVFDYDARLSRYRFAGTVNGYGRPLEAAQSAISRPSAASAVPSSERRMVYGGIGTYKRLTIVQGVDLKINGTQITGIFGQRLFGQTINSKLTGEIANGTCTLQIGKDRLIGACDARGFSGQRLSKSGEVVGTFSFKAESEIMGSRAGQ